MPPPTLSATLHAHCPPHAQQPLDSAHRMPECCPCRRHCPRHEPRPSAGAHLDNRKSPSPARNPDHGDRASASAPPATHAADQAPSAITSVARLETSSRSSGHGPEQGPLLTAPGNANQASTLTRRGTRPASPIQRSQHEPPDRTGITRTRGRERQVAGTRPGRSTDLDRRGTAGRALVTLQGTALQPSANTHGSTR